MFCNYKTFVLFLQTMSKEPTYSHLQDYKKKDRIKIWRHKHPCFTAWYYESKDAVQIINWKDTVEENKQAMLIEKARKYIKHEIIKGQREWNNIAVSISKDRNAGLII